MPLFPRPAEVAMKHPKLLVLIALALMLGGAREACAQPSPGTISPNSRDPAIGKASATVPNRAEMARVATQNPQRAVEQEVHVKRQEDLAVKTLTVTQKTLDVTQQSLDIDRWLVGLTAVLAVINFFTMVVFYCTMRATIVAANATSSAVQVSKSAVRPYIWVRKVAGERGRGH